jgi:hypothetical protein
VTYSHIVDSLVNRFLVLSDLSPASANPTPDSINAKPRARLNSRRIRSFPNTIINMTSLPPPTGDTILFRPGKKRKIYRQRPDEALPEPQPTSPGTSPAPAQANPQSIDELIASTSANLPSGSAGEGDELEGTPVSISEILRLRKKNKRIGGVEFRAEGHISRDEDGALVIRHALGEAGAQSTEGESGPVIRKFTPQTGAVGDVNKHM